ncbi:hypothetical protein ACRE1S_06150 [Helicobacter himalayensis]|uniref:hypothetical protein n=1 Tax=Helicobacter himalayensis TaxID=1591088 RepID=UPI003D6FFF89
MQTQEIQQIQLDNFSQHLDDEIRILQSCQQEKSLHSCMPCDSFFSCQKRKNYVKAVYDNLNKGQDGAFDFN